jgi:hypothetical protein
VSGGVKGAAGVLAPLCTVEAGAVVLINVVSKWL